LSENETRKIPFLQDQINQVRKEIRALRIVVLDHEQKLELIKELLKAMLEKWPKE